MFIIKELNSKKVVYIESLFLKSKLFVNIMKNKLENNF
jgi:hypothetical protein